MGGMPGMGGVGGGVRSRADSKAPPVSYPLRVTLEEVFTGATKRMRITKKIMDSSGNTMPVTSDKEIKVKPGWKDGTKITFEKEGDELPNTIPADIIFTVEAKPHDRFKRDGDDLIYTCDVSLADALTGVRTSITTLDNRRLPIEARNVTPQTEKVVPGEGMPNSKKGTKGDMKVKFNIAFPDLSSSQRTQIVRILEQSNTAMQT